LNFFESEKEVNQIGQKKKIQIADGRNKNMIADGRLI